MKLILLSILISMLTIAKSVAGSVKVMDSNSERSIQGASVHFKCIEGNCKDSTLVIVSDKNGIAKLPFDKKTAVFISYIGYQRASDTINVNDNITINLKAISIMMNEVVTTGQFVPQTTQKSVYPVKTISSEKIQLQAANNLRELLTNETNIRLAQDNILGSSMSINGVAGQNIKILIDGVPVIGRVNGNIDISQLNLNNVERIEIIEGPMSSIYGSDALGGVVNIITKEPLCERYEVEGRAYYESIGAVNIDAQARYNFGNYNLMLSGGRNVFMGFSENQDSRFMQWKPREQYFADWQYGREFEKMRIRYLGRYFDEYILNRGEPRRPYNITAFDDTYKTRRLSNSLYLNGEVGGKKFYDVILSHSFFDRRKNTFFKDLTDLSEIPVADPSMHDTSAFSSYLIRAVFSNDNFTNILGYQLGIDFNLDAITGRRIENQASNINDYGFFTTLQIKPLENIIIQPSIRYIYNTQFTPDIFPNLIENINIPLLPALNMKYDLNENLSFRASYSRGFRAPSLRELYFFFVDINHDIRGNKDLQPETSDSYGASAHFVSNSNDFVFKIDAKGFYNDIDNLITLAAIQDASFTYVNTGNFKTIGGDLTFSYFQDNISAKIAGTYIGRMNTFANGFSTNQFNYSPELLANISYHFRASDLKLSAFYKYTGEFPVVNVNSSGEVFEFFIEDFHTLDITADKGLFENLMTLQFGVKNVFNVSNIRSSGTVGGGAHSAGSNSLAMMWGRTFFTTLRFNVR